MLDEIGNGHDGQVQLQLVPTLAAIETKHKTRVRRRRKAIRPLVLILADDFDEIVGIDPGGNFGPGFAVVHRFIGERSHVVELVPRGRNVRRAFVVRRNLNGLDEAFRQAGGRDVLPGFAAVAGEVHEAAIAAGVNEVLFERRFEDVIDGVVVFAARAFVGERAAAISLFCGIIAGQVGADGLPVQAAVGGFKQHIRCVVNDRRIVRGSHDGRIPVEAVLHLFGRIGQIERGVLHDVLALHRAGVQRFDHALIAAAVHHYGVHRVERDVGAFATRPFKPVLVGNAVAVVAAVDDHRGVVLLAAINAVREALIHVHAVELRGGLVVQGRPALAGVETDFAAAVVAEDHVLVVLGLIHRSWVSPWPTLILLKLLPPSIERIMGALSTYTMLASAGSAKTSM